MSSDTFTPKQNFIQQFPRFGNYYSQLDKLALLVEEKSKQFNITSIRSYEDIWTKHIIDSLMVCKFVKIAHRVIDIGTGAGFPGLPLAITHPSAQFTLVDSTRKKVEVVNEFTSRLELRNVQAVWARAEGLSKDSAHKSSYNIVTARAVAYLPELLKLLYPFMKPGGQIVLYKKYDKNEIKEGDLIASKLSLERIEEHKYKLFDADVDRVILIYSF